MDKSEKNYTVITYSVGGKNNMVYKSGGKVKESNFPPGNAEKLAEQGFLKEFTKAQQAKAEKAAKAEREAAQKTKEESDTKALQDAESALEEADMAVTIAQEKVDDLNSQMEGDVDDKAKLDLDKELTSTNNALHTAKEVAENAKSELEALKSS